MANSNHIKALFNKPKIDFEQHLVLKDNSRIIFSGIYGIGKSYFLSNFFSLEDMADKYEVVTLRPVNYSISANEDILKYIKYDLLIELIAKKIEVAELGLKLPDYMQLYVQENWKKIGIDVLKIAVKLEKVKNGGIDILGGVFDFFKHLPSIKEFKTQKKEQFDEGEILSSFMDKVEKESNFLSDSLVTTIIENKILSLKKKLNGEKKETILIIDDLDRIDPEHIFRILNIFAAHYENVPFSPSTFRNKFAFDKIVLVCDINNIRSIFHNRYGLNVDFTGYIDKFYSHEVFSFDLRNLIVPIIFEVSSKLNLEDKRHKQQLTKADDQAFHYFIRALFKKNLINLRSFLKYYESRENISFKPTNIGGYDIDPAEVTLLWQLILLKQLLGDRDSFQRAIQQLTIADIVNADFDSDKVFYQLLFLGSLRQHQMNPQKGIVYSLNDNIKFIFSVDESSIQYNKVSHASYYDELDHNYDSNDPIHEINNCYDYVMPLLNKVIGELINMNVIK